MGNNERRVALVTGASRGIGRAIAKRLASDGHHVVLVARDQSRLDEVLSEIEADGGVGESRACDLGDPASLEAMMESVLSDRGRLDVLVNNAGINRDGLILRMSDEDFDEVLAVNLRATFITCRAVARSMMRGRWGRIINISSVTGLVGNPGQANYAAAKAGMVGMTKTLAKELGSKGITANVVAPGFIETDMTEAMSSEILAEAAKRLPLRRLGRPEEIAHAVAYLASEDAGYVTGQVLTVDGGMVC
ncbi:MAG: 3-oxoacyl-[acyl-carrier-protein] reductase [Phycisphaerae bacterium]|mgnify:CR=1 FL=1|nr:3-oxoacyl-[acyl-carrier-protein] reductase [Phycisphaerae bacterium]|tara:strand:- start:1361 stop:2104 length:744 start_codon:yes stop_codon:yes gene_type:complete